MITIRGGMILIGRSSNFSLTDNKYKFTGKERDIETNYDYFGARYYDSRIGRWLSIDPLAEKYPGWSPYNYTLNNPIINFDPNGKYTKSFIFNNYYFHRFTLLEAEVHTKGQAFIPTDAFFGHDPSFNSSINKSRWDNPFTRNALENVFNSILWKSFNKGVGFYEASNDWSEVRSNFVYDEAAFNYALGIEYEGISAVQQGEIVGFNKDGSPIFEESADGTMLRMNPEYVDKKFGGDLEKAQKEIDETMQEEKIHRGLTGGKSGFGDYIRYIEEKTKGH